MDVLSSVIATARTGTPNSGMFARHAPWGRRYPIVPGAGFHVVLQGTCWLRPPGSEPIAMGTGDVLFMPRGTAHDIADSLETPITETAHPGEPRELPGPGLRCVLLCGAYELDRHLHHPLLSELPEFVHLPAQPGRHPGLRGAVELLTTEIAAPGEGSHAAVPALLDMLLVFILRAWLDEQAGADRSAGWAFALGDSQVAAALKAIHNDPARPWTTAGLGAVAGISRATLARRFAATVGEPPLSYLTRWRMLTAARKLRDTTLPLATVAREVGYSSEFAFAKAFKRHYNTAPGHYRRSVA